MEFSRVIYVRKVLINCCPDYVGVFMLYEKQWDLLRPNTLCQVIDGKIFFDYFPGKFDMKFW